MEAVSAKKKCYGCGTKHDQIVCPECGALVGKVEKEPGCTCSPVGSMAGSFFLASDQDCPLHGEDPALEAK